MLAAVQRVVPAGRAGRAGGAALQPEHQVRRGAGHGDGPVHDGLPAGLPGVGVPALGHRLPGPDQPRPSQPLHAHVRDAEHGRRRPEPQEGRREQELDPQDVLLEQCELWELILPFSPSFC